MSVHHQHVSASSAHDDEQLRQKVILQILWFLEVFELFFKQSYETHFQLQNF